MKNLKQYIKEEISKLQEAEYNAPSEILDTLKNRLELNPLIRYIDYLKAVNSVPPSYRIFLHNEEFFDIIYRDFSLMAKIGSKEYYLDQKDETNLAIKHINRLLTGPKMRPGEPEDEEDMDTPTTPAKKPAAPSLPSPPPPPEPEDEE